MEDDEDRDDYAENSVDVKDVHRTLGRAKRMRRRWYGGGPKGAEAIEDALVEKYTPRVRQYLIENKAMKKDRLAVRPPLPRPCPFGARCGTDGFAANLPTARRLDPLDRTPL